jgi:hypothetical protein
MKSPFEHGDFLFFVTCAAIVSISVINKIMQLFRKKNTAGTEDVIWLIVTLNAIFYTIFAGMAYRMLPYAMMFSLPLTVDFGMNSDFTKSLGNVSKIFLTGFISAFFVFCTASWDHRKDKEEKISASYTKEELFEMLDNLSEKPVVIMAHVNDGPQILYYTKHSVVGAPYHRQTEGIIFSYKVTEEKYDEKTVREILEKTDSSYIFIRKEQYKNAKTNSLAKMITENAAPERIEIIKLPPQFDDVVIAKIKK